MTTKPPTGTARYDTDARMLTVTRSRKLRGKKIVMITAIYLVDDARPDKRVANPAFTLTKLDGTVYHVSCNEWGPRCDCIDGEIREKRGHGPCKHAKALMAVGLLPP